MTWSAPTSPTEVGAGALETSWTKTSGSRSLAPGRSWSLSRTFGKRVLFTIPLDRVEHVEVRLRYGGTQITAWTTREDGRRIGVYASPLALATTRPMLVALGPQVEARPELLMTRDDRESYAYSLKNS